MFYILCKIFQVNIANVSIEYHQQHVNVQLSTNLYTYRYIHHKLDGPHILTYFKQSENIIIMTNCTVKSLMLFYKNDYGFIFLL